MTFIVIAGVTRSICGMLPFSLDYCDSWIIGNRNGFPTRVRIDKKPAKS
jgi:hypothetical protein